MSEPIKKKGFIASAIDPVTSAFNMLTEFFKLLNILLPVVIKAMEEYNAEKEAERKRIKDSEDNANLQAKLGAEREYKKSQDNRKAFAKLEQKIWIDTYVQLVQMLKENQLSDIKVYLGQSIRDVIKNEKIDNILYNDNRDPEDRAIDLVYIMKNV